jgi:hypothetical protein
MDTIRHKWSNVISIIFNTDKLLTIAIIDDSKNHERTSLIKKSMDIKRLKIKRINNCLTKIVNRIKIKNKDTKLIIH